MPDEVSLHWNAEGKVDGYMGLKEGPISNGAQYNVGEINLPDTAGHGADVCPDFLKQFCTMENYRQKFHLLVQSRRPKGTAVFKPLSS